MNRLVSGIMISILAMAVMPVWHAAEASIGNKLVVAALRGDSTEVRKLLSKGASPNFADKDGCTPLIAAAGGGAKELEVWGNAITSKPAASRGTAEIVRILLAAGASPDPQDNRRSTALMYAAEYGNTDRFAHSSTPTPTPTSRIRKV